MYRFTSCRKYVDKIYFYTELVYGSKEVVQVLKWTLLSDDELRAMYCDELVFAHRFIKSPDDFIKIVNNTKRDLDKSNIIIIEISCLKEICYDNRLILQCYLHDQVFVRNGPTTEKETAMFGKIEISIQTEEMLVNDLDYITNYFSNKKVIFIPHINAKIIKDGCETYIPYRQLLCDTFRSYTSNKENVYLFDPTDYLGDDPEKIFNKKDDVYDYYHYSDSASILILEKMQEFLKSIEDKN